MCDEDEKLVRFHFGDLDEVEYAEMERRLESEPQLAERLEKIRGCLAIKGLDGAAKGLDGPCPESDPPPPVPARLADRTTDAVLSNCLESHEACSGRRKWCPVEVAVVGFAAVLLASLAVPALQAARESARRDFCANSLGDVYKSLALYSAEHRSRFPEISPDENAGLFAVTLADGGYADRGELANRLVCPSSEFAVQVAERRAAVVVPTRLELLLAPAWLRSQLVHQMAGNQTYRIGHVEQGGYRYPKCKVSCRSALLADSPEYGEQGRLVGRSHCGTGLNVLFEDGHVAFLTGFWAPGSEDNLFLNDRGEVAAGVNACDTVLAPSWATPSAAPVVFIKH